MGLRQFLLGVPWNEKTPSQKLRAFLGYGLLFFALPVPIIAPLVLGMNADEFWVYYTPVFQGILVLILLGAMIALGMMLYEVARRRFGSTLRPAPQPQPEPPKAKASPKPKQTKPKAKAPRKPKPKPAPKTDEEAVFERRVFDDPDEEKPKAKVRLEREPKHKGGNSRREKLEALAQDENAPPDERIAALNKLKDLKDD